ncbi:MAG: hypothetical protein HRT61_06925 [Ekhidna sp.]|nr:hypothetical protein [Ekhidna sp.]
MLDSITKGFAKIFGTKTEKDLKELKPYVGLINKEFEQLETYRMMSSEARQANSREG